MNDKLRGMILGGFVADALALGPHWIYDMQKIEKEFGEIKGITAPLSDSFHKGKTKGDFTHYGDQMIFFLEYLKENGAFNPVQFKDAWCAFMEIYDGYKDHATKDTMQSYGQTHELNGSTSDELGGAVRMAPLVYYLARQALPFEKEGVVQTQLTHTGGDILNIAKALTLIIDKVLKGKAPTQAMEETANEVGGAVQDYINQAIAHEMVEPHEMIPVFGQHCSSKAAFPSALYLIHRYESDFETALLENIQVGGDSAARGIVIGMILGAHHGESVIPKRWLEDMNAYERILKCL